MPRCRTDRPPRHGGHTPGGTGYVIPNDPNHPDVTPSDTVAIAYTNDARFREQGAKADAALQAAEAVMGMAGIGASSPVDSQTAALVRQAEHHLAEVDAAYARIGTGDYGSCEVCGETIPAGTISQIARGLSSFAKKSCGEELPVAPS